MPEKIGSTPLSPRGAQASRPPPRREDQLGRGVLAGPTARGLHHQRPLVVMPGTLVSYAPDIQAHVFVYTGRSSTVATGVWSMASAYHGPWAVIQIGQVPACLTALCVLEHERHERNLTIYKLKRYLICQG
jgi:hypothetical protein